MWLRAVLLVLALAVVVAGAVFSWDRWLRYDDAADFRGSWIASGTDAFIEIGEDSVMLTPDVTYEYTLDTGAKTIAFSFGDLSGQGRYRFSADRAQVAIIEGEGFSWLTTLSDDLAYAVQCAVANISGNPAPPLAEGENAVVLGQAIGPSPDPSGEEVSKPSSDDAGLGSDSSSDDAGSSSSSAPDAS